MNFLKNVEIMRKVCYNRGKSKLPGGNDVQLGEKLRRARLDAGLSQRQLCGDVITRNMLSQIESGKAKPSMATLQYLAAALKKPIGYFLEENTACSDNIGQMEQARTAYAARDYAAVMRILAAYRRPDALFDAECSYLTALCALELGKQRMEEAEFRAATELLEGVDRSSLYYREDMENRRRRMLSVCYEALEQYYREQEDFKQAYFYACRGRAFSNR